MSREIPATQHLYLHFLGRYPEINEKVSFRDYGGDSDICIEREITREFNIQDQNIAEFWDTLRDEFWETEVGEVWPDHEDDIC